MKCYMVINIILFYIEIIEKRSGNIKVIIDEYFLGKKGYKYLYWKGRVSI